MGDNQAGNHEVGLLFSMDVRRFCAACDLRILEQATAVYLPLGRGYRFSVQPPYMDVCSDWSTYAYYHCSYVLRISRALLATFYLGELYKRSPPVRVMKP